jgi:hypothetical protein
MYGDASQAAEQQSGLPPQTHAEREDDRAWRAQVDRKRARSRTISNWVALLLLVFIGLPLLYKLIRETLFGD